MFDLKAWKLKNKETLKKKRKEWKSKNREKLRKQNRDLYAKDIELSRSKNRQRYQKNIEKKRIYAKTTMQNNYDTNTAWLISQGFSCKRCGYNEFFCSIDGHHTDPTKKKNSGDLLSKWLRRLSPESFKAKILDNKDGIMFLCRNCHCGLENKEWSIEELR